jgi:hypothetical protein
MFVFAKRVERACEAAGHRVNYAADMGRFMMRMNTRASVCPESYELYCDRHAEAVARGCSVCGRAVAECVGSMAFTDDPIAFYPLCLDCASGRPDDVIVRVITMLGDAAGRAHEGGRVAERAQDLACDHGRGPAMLTDTELESARQRLSEVFPSRSNHLLFQLQFFAETGQHFDVTFHDREPVLDVSIHREYARVFLTALKHWRGDKLANLLKRIHFDDGTITPIDTIWVIVPLPPVEITIAMLESADLTMAEAVASANGETVREMVRAVYRCESAAEEDWFVRRWIAS